ncbi:PepSY domain-containing protein, partial [Pseudomonas gingeri]|uniref:PepSY domain-containing protein n=2 Tax=Pseudomonas TaxID=286 RepID=UPI0015A02BF1
MRALLVLLHRYIGLATALFLMIAGITGSLLAFNHELDEWLNPGFYKATAEGLALPP